MKRILFLLPILAAGLVSSAHAQLIVYSFNGDVKTPTTDTNADANGGAVTGVGFTLTDSFSGNPAPSVGAALDQIATNISLTDDYFTFTISKEAAASSYTLAQISFDYQVGVYSNPVHETNFSLYSSVTGFANTGQQIASFNFDNSPSGFLSTGPISLGSSFQNLTADTEFRIYLDDNGSGSAAVSARVDNISISNVPEPTTAVMLLGGLGMLVLRRRR